MPLLLFHGDNTIEIDEAVRAARARFQALDTISFEGKELTWAALSEACLTVGLFDPERLVIVHNLHERLKGARKEGGEAEALAGILHAVAPTTTLLLVSGEPLGDHQLVKMVQEAGGEIRTFALPRKGELPRWVVARAQRLGATLDREAAELLVHQLGSDPLLLESELEKLATYAGGERITPRMVETLVAPVTQESIFALVDAIAGGEEGKALRLLHAQLEAASAGPIEFAVYLIRMLARQARILLRIRLAQEAGRSTQQISADLKLPRYYADRYFRQARRLSQPRLTRCFEQLAALEYGLKSGQADPGSGLDLLVADLCA